MDPPFYGSLTFFYGKKIQACRRWIERQHRGVALLFFSAACRHACQLGRRSERRPPHHQVQGAVSQRLLPSAGVVATVFRFCDASRLSVSERSLVE